MNQQNTARDEVTASMVMALFGKAEKIMKERGLAADQIASSFLSEGIDQLWIDEDREGLRAKAYTAVSAYVDGLYENIGDQRKPSPHPELDDPVFHARAHALIAKEERTFQAWLATGDLDTLISEAVAAGKNAFVNADDDDSKPRSWAVIDLGHRRAKPLVLALQQRKLGALKASDLTYIIAPHEFTKLTNRNRGPELAAIEAFAMALSRPGFEIMTFHENQALAA